MLEKVEGNQVNLALIMTSTASSQYSTSFTPAKANDGIYSSENESNAWATQNNQDVNSWWKVDLGSITDIGTVNVQYRGFGTSKVFHFVPATVTFQVSDDDADWTTVISKSTNVPANNTSFSDTLYTYTLNTSGRYLRLLFEDGSNDTSISGYDLCELVEVEVY